MSATNWGPLDRISAAKRAAARDSWNHRRTVRAGIRKLQAVALYFKLGCKPGAQAEVARMLGVHRSFVCRAIALWNLSYRLDMNLKDLELHQRIRDKLRKRELRIPMWGAVTSLQMG